MSRCRIDRSLIACCFALLLLLSGCQVDWATWGFGVERQGFNPAESTIGPSNVAQLRHLWSVNVGADINTGAAAQAAFNESKWRRSVATGKRLTTYTTAGGRLTVGAGCPPVLGAEPALG